ncbi:MAG TPA: phasin family protein [Burkholderiaceae bacterium]|nr:phasin family protein [Burkholderiaceae bacterium]
MTTTKSNTNPIASFYEAQTAATAEIVQAALKGMQRLQQITLQALRAGAGGQFSLAQSMTTMRDGGDVNRALTGAAAPVAEQGARYQRELLQAIADMNSDIARASYSMMERMRDALGAATQGSLNMASIVPPGSDPMNNPMALYDSAMRQWQTAAQQMMEAPSAAAMAGGDERPYTTPARKSKGSAKRKSSSRKR